MISDISNVCIHVCIYSFKERTGTVSKKEYKILDPPNVSSLESEVSDHLDGMFLVLSVLLIYPMDLSLLINFEKLDIYVDIVGHRFYEIVSAIARLWWGAHFQLNVH